MHVEMIATGFKKGDAEHWEKALDRKTGQAF